MLYAPRGRSRRHRRPDRAAAPGILVQARGAAREVEWSTAIAHLAALSRHLRSYFALVSDDGLYGFAVSTYVGYLPWEMDGAETVYRVARWYPR